MNPRNDSRQRFIGALEILGSGLAFGFLGIFGKFAFAAGLSAGEFLALRFLGAAWALGLGFLCFARAELALGRTTILRCLALGILGYAVFSSCFFTALEHLSASLTVLLLYLYPAFVAVGASLFLRERLAPSARVALPLAMLGLVLLMGGDFAAHSAWGLAAGVGSAFFYSIYILLSRSWLRGVNPLAAVFYIQLGAAVVLLALHFRGEAALADKFLAAPWSVAAASLLSSVLAMALFLSGLRRLRAAEAAILSTAEPITAIVAAGLIFGERLGAAQWLGAALVLSALVLLARPARERGLQT